MSDIQVGDIVRLIDAGVAPHSARIAPYYEKRLRQCVRVQKISRRMIYPEPLDESNYDDTDNFFYNGTYIWRFERVTALDQIEGEFIYGRTDRN